MKNKKKKKGPTNKNDKENRKMTKKKTNDLSQNIIKIFR